MKVTIEVSNKNIKDLILEYIKEKLGPEADLKIEDINIKVKSSQNYRNHEWENGELKVTYEGEV